MEMNPYQAPEATVVDVVQAEGLAGPGTRLLAAIVDAVILLALWLPVVFLTGYWQKVTTGTLGVAGTVGYAIAAFLVFVLIQGYPLATRGQTWGKRMLSIRIATLQGGKPTLATLLLRRYLPVQLIGAVPGIGLLLTLVNVLFIFRADRRCVHDLIAGTKVVET